MSESTTRNLIGSRPVQAHVPMHVIDLTDPRIGNFPQQGRFVLPKEVARVLSPLTHSDGFLGFCAPVSEQTDRIISGPNRELIRHAVVGG